MKAKDLIKKLEKEVAKNPEAEVLLDCGENIMSEKILCRIGRVKYSTVRKVVLVYEGRIL